MGKGGVCHVLFLFSFSEEKLKVLFQFIKTEMIGLTAKTNNGRYLKMISFILQMVAGHIGFTPLESPQVHGQLQ